MWQNGGKSATRRSQKLGTPSIPGDRFSPFHLHPTVPYEETPHWKLLTIPIQAVLDDGNLRFESPIGTGSGHQEHPVPCLLEGNCAERVESRSQSTNSPFISRQSSVSRIPRGYSTKRRLVQQLRCELDCRSTKGSVENRDTCQWFPKDKCTVVNNAMLVRTQLQ